MKHVVLNFDIINKLFSSWGSTKRLQNNIFCLIKTRKEKKFFIGLILPLLTVLNYGSLIFTNSLEQIRSQFRILYRVMFFVLSYDLLIMKSYSCRVLLLEIEAKNWAAGTVGALSWVDQYDMRDINRAAKPSKDWNGIGNIPEDRKMGVNRRDPREIKYWRLSQQRKSVPGQVR